MNKLKLLIGLALIFWSYSDRSILAGVSPSRPSGERVESSYGISPDQVYCELHIPERSMYEKLIVSNQGLETYEQAYQLCSQAFGVPYNAMSFYISLFDPEFGTRMGMQEKDPTDHLDENLDIVYLYFRDAPEGARAKDEFLERIRDEALARLRWSEDRAAWVSAVIRSVFDREAREAKGR